MELVTFLLDDEQACLDTLKYEIQRNCPSIRISGWATNPKTAVNQIKQLQPDLLILDIKMPEMDGFAVVEALQDALPHIIFTTAHDEYAIQAFKVNALDYILKPVDGEDLSRAVKRVEDKVKAEGQNGIKLELLLEQLRSRVDGEHAKVPIPVYDGLQFIDPNEIVYCKAESNYTNIVLAKSKPILVSKTLREIEEILPVRLFMRVHHSYLINVNCIEKYVRSDGGYLIMSNNDTVKIARSRKTDLLKLF